MLSWKLEEKKLNLIYNWKISRNTSFEKVNFIISVNDKNNKGLGESAPNIRYQETPELIKVQFEAFLSNSPEKIKNLDELQNLLNFSQICNSLRFGIESAYVHYLSQMRGIEVFELLRLPYPGHIYTAYTLPIMDPGEVEAFIKKFRLDRFKMLKVKTGKEGAFELIREIHRHSSVPLMVDANEAWTNVEDLLRFLEQIRVFRIEFIEQPLPSGLEDEYKYLKSTSPFIVMGDESVTDKGEFSKISHQFHGINVKLMKSGGYLKGIHLLKEARNCGLKTMIGCMVETTLGIYSAMNLCGLVDYVDLDGFFIIENEPFELIKENNGQLFFNH